MFSLKGENEMNINKQSEPIVFLEGEKIILRPLNKKTDIDNCLRWINNPEVRQYILNTFPINYITEEAWFDNQTNNREQMNLAIVKKETKEHIGNISLCKINWVDRSGTTGMLIGSPDNRGKGYGEEAKKLLLDYAFNRLGLNRITAEALENNKVSIKCLEKCGYKKEGTMRESSFRNGKFINNVLMSILKKDWDKLNK